MSLIYRPPGSSQRKSVLIAKVLVSFPFFRKSPPLNPNTPLAWIKRKPRATLSCNLKRAASEIVPFAENLAG